MTHPLCRPIAARCSLLVAVLACSPGALVAQGPARPSWTCLPADTIAVARIPNAPAFYEAFRKQTRIGAMILADDRVKKFMEIMAKYAEIDDEEVRRNLGQYDLNPDEWPKLFTGEMGVGITLREGDGLDPIIFLWFEPGDDLAGRLLLAMNKLVAEQEDGADMTKRVDLELAGIPVTRLTMPEIEPDLSNVSLPEFPEGDDDEDGPSDAEIEKWEEETERLTAQAPRTLTGQTNVFVARMGGRILAAISSYSKVPEEALAPDADLAALSGVEETTQAFGRFLARHATDEPNEFAEVMKTPGFSEISDQGIPLFEFVVDPRPLLSRGNSEIPEEVRAQSRAAGGESLGPMIFRSNLDGTIMRTSGFLSLPEPRVGVFKVFEPSSQSLDPPDWLPSNVLSYTRVHFDFAKAWNVVKDLALASAGEEFAKMLQQGDATLNLVLQTDILSLLGSFGDRHEFVTFEPAPARLVDEGTPFDALGIADRRMGLVWQTRDEALWKRILNLAANSSAQIGGKPASEQGFSGLRFEGKGLQGGFFVGNGYIVLGMGDQTIETILSSLRSPPQGAASFRESGVFARAKRLLISEPTLYLSVTDSDKVTSATFGDVFERFQSLEDSGLMAGVDTEELDFARQFLEVMRSMTPTGEDAKNLLNVGVDQMTVTPRGLAIHSIVEYQAP